LLVLMGLRGALALALALGLPVGTPGRDDVVTVTFAVVSFSILVQGLTIQPVLARVIRSRRAETQPMPSAAPGA
jgi:CPA1 family monovalent cation:H+ antiporter